MTATKSKYWGVQEDGKIGFTGTFNECWEFLVKNFGEQTLNELDKFDVKITRIK